MKKSFFPVILVLLVALCAFLGACGNGEHNEDGEGEGQTVPAMEGFTLEEAYEAGLLTVADLETLSQFPSKDDLDKDVALAIKTSYAAQENEKYPSRTPYSAKDIGILGYFGEYHGLYAVRLLPKKAGVLEVVIEKDIGGVHFVYGQPPEMTVWREVPEDENGEEFDGEVKGELFGLEEAYEKGFITQPDLKQIAYYHNHVKNYPRPLNSKAETVIKELEAEKERTWEEFPIPDFKAEGVHIIAFYGRYSNCYVVRLYCDTEDYLGDKWAQGDGWLSYWDEIGGVPFYLSSNYSIKVFVVQE